MIIVDTSIWIDHFRRFEPRLQNLLDGRLVIMHPLVRGELAMGNLKNRQHTLAMLADLNTAERVTDAEVMGLVEQEKLYGKGVGFNDAHLIASARLMVAKLWSKDRHLAAAAFQCGVSHEH